MSLAAGTKLGPYEIVAAAGAGGMGEVYRARDTRLDRTVAIKVLPSHLSSNEELKQRFEREARAISSLNHPHICILHDIGSQDGTDYLVMEYLDGQTLADRLKKGPLSLDQVVKIGSEIADALDKAHLQGIVHRDLKPGNIMLTASGAKLMDFGLAKPALAVAASVGGPVTPATPTMDLSALTSAVSPMTQKGTIVGTFQYIAPEVLQGQPADPRSDLFSFGCVLYEMVTGRRAFEGKSQLSVLTAILEKEPEPLHTAAPASPRMLQNIIHGCLEKDPALRLQSAHDIGLQLGWMGTKEEPIQQHPVARSPLGWVVAAVLLLAMSAGAIWLKHSWPTRPLMQVAIPAADGMTTETLGDYAAPPTISPDGTMLVLRASTKASPIAALWLRHLDTGTWQRLDGTEAATFPFWSPDSKNLGFFTSDGRMCRMNINGGAITVIAPIRAGKGASWGEDGTILYAPDFQSGLYRVSADGGTPIAVTQLDRPAHTTHRWPVLMPDGKHFIYFAGNHSGVGGEHNGIYFASLDGKINKELVPSDGSAEYSSGYLLYLSGKALLARRFDPSSGEFKADAVTVSDDIQYDPSVWHTSVSISKTGLLVEERGGQTSGARLSWFDRTGKSEVLSNIPQGDYDSLRLAPDGRRIAVVNLARKADIWIIDALRGTPTRLTFGDNNHFAPVWSPDGKRIAYGEGSPAGITSAFSLGSSIHIRNADGSGSDEQILAGDPSISLSVLDWTHDGKYVLFNRGTGPMDNAIWALPVSGDHKPFAVVTPPTQGASAAQGQVSYDGRWIAYTSNESGRTEVYITSFPNAGGKVQVTSNGGLHPVWRSDDKELFFVRANDSMLMAIDLKIDKSGIQVGQPHPLFSLVTSNHQWDASADGKRFLVATIPQSQGSPISLVTNWTALLEKK